MATAEVGRGPRRDEGTLPAQPDIVLTPEELDDLYEAMYTAFPEDTDAQQLLRRIGYPRQRIPTFTGRHRDAWNDVFRDFELGVIDNPYRRTLAAALRVYQVNRDFLGLAECHGLLPDRTPQPAPAPGEVATISAAVPAPEPSTPNCHVIVSALDEDTRQHATDVLRRLDLNPSEVWATGTAISFEVGSADAPGVRRELEDTELGWTVVEAGQPDYLLSRLYVQGPDRRRFQIIDAPAQQTFRHIAEAVILDHYPQGDPNAELPTMIELVQNGERRSVNPDTTLHDAGVSDGDQVQVAYQTNAGAINPIRHEEALYSARNQILDFAESRTGFLVGANAPRALLPTQYELEFTQRSYGFTRGAREPDEPIEIERHVVSLQLGPDFPVEAPKVWWLTQIFHPNIYPTYDSRLARLRPGSRGLVCLGAIGESWQETMDLGHLCWMLGEIAGFRNYATFEVVPDRHGRPALKGDCYDVRAAWWAIDHEDKILAVGGKILFRPQRGRTTYHNVIEPLGPAGRST